jgi:hypothetical protein
MTNDENSEAEKNPPAAMASPPESVAAMIAAAGKSMDEATARRMAAERLNFLAPGCAYPELGPDELLGTGDQSADYHRGRRAMAANILGSCLRELGVNDPIAARSAWVMERQGAIRVLRDVCAEYGDNDWPDSLVLEDVIEKHLHRNLDDSFKDEEFDDAGDGDTEAPLNLAGWGLDLFDSILDGPGAQPVLERAEGGGPGVPGRGSQACPHLAGGGRRGVAGTRPGRPIALLGLPPAETQFGSSLTNTAIAGNLTSVSQCGSEIGG